MGGGPAPQQYATFVKSAERQSGLIDILHKDDEVYFDLGPEQLDHPFIVAPVLASGVGSEAFAGRIFPSFVIEFRRVGKRILWIDKNSDFTAPPGSSAANALAISVTDSVINSTPIVAEDEAKKHIVISAGFFLTDFENVGRDLGGPQGPAIIFGLTTRASFSVDGSKSYLERTKALPKNDELLASLAFSGPAGDISGAPDGRGVRLRMHYSIVEPPALGNYIPRIADDRVGYFITAQKRFDNDSLPTPFVRYIDRWNFASGPIVYYLTNEIPSQYKPAIRSALLEWNAAFAKIGIPNAVEVRDQPNDPNWDPDDVRYSTVRWITSDHSPFAAYGPHIADPRTGQILRVEIVIDGESMRSVKRGYADQVRPTRAVALDTNGLPVADGVTLRCPDLEACDDYDESSAETAALGTDALREGGAGPAQTERFAEDWLHSVVLHESGHNFGLRHNFISSTLYPLSRIHDPKFSAAHGIVGSVMGYTPINLSPPGKPQGQYFQMKLGPYDYWAIRYGYETFPNVRRPEDELKALHGVADESTNPEYAFETDEDANGPLAIDPRVATYALSSDPLAFDRNQYDVIDGLLAKLDSAYPRDDEPYYQERQTFSSMLRAYQRTSLLAAKYIGGIYTSRDHRGQRGGEPPFAPVPREESRRAFALLLAATDRGSGTQSLPAPRHRRDRTSRLSDCGNGRGTAGPNHVRTLFARRDEPARRPEFRGYDGREADVARRPLRLDGERRVGRRRQRHELRRSAASRAATPLHHADGGLFARAELYRGSRRVPERLGIARALRAAARARAHAGGIAFAQARCGHASASRRHRKPRAARARSERQPRCLTPAS